MKIIRLAILILPLLATPLAWADFYQWTDSGGVLHMTDDPDNIPKAYRGKAARLKEGPETPKPAAGTAPVPRAAPEASAPKAPTPGGHDEQWWRGRFRGLRAELKSLQDARAQKEQRLVERRRERVIFQRARDRTAINALQAEIASDDARISETLNKITALELAAAREGVPSEWLR